nr:MAG TPA: hypothetical protein [Caudoviricetes sp.]
MPPKIFKNLLTQTNVCVIIPAEHKQMYVLL